MAFHVVFHSSSLLLFCAYIILWALVFSAAFCVSVQQTEEETLEDSMGAFHGSSSFSKGCASLLPTFHWPKCHHVTPVQGRLENVVWLCTQEEKEIGFDVHMTVFSLCHRCVQGFWEHKGKSFSLFWGFREGLWRRWFLHCVLKDK